MAIGDYILCCKCEVKLIYDGDRNQREWWEERFGKEPEIECPNCKPQRKPLTDDLYNELLFAVGNKCPNETRHQTALRYILQAEKGDEKAAHDIKETK